MKFPGSIFDVNSDIPSKFREEYLIAFSIFPDLCSVKSFSVHPYWLMESEGGGTTRLMIEKRQMQSIRFSTSVIEILLDNFQNNFRNLFSSRGLSRDHYWRKGIQEINDFRGF